MESSTIFISISKRTGWGKNLGTYGFNTLPQSLVIFTDAIVTHEALAMFKGGQAILGATKGAWLGTPTILATILAATISLTVIFTPIIEASAIIVAHVQFPSVDVRSIAGYAVMSSVFFCISNNRPTLGIDQIFTVDDLPRDITVSITLLIVVGTLCDGKRICSDNPVVTVVNQNVMHVQFSVADGLDYMVGWGWSQACF
jgi:hypothetical protein